MLLMSTLNGASLVAVLAVAAVAVILLVVAWRMFVAAIVLASAAFIIWHLDLSRQIANARRFGDQYLHIPLSEVHFAHFGLGLVSGLVLFSTLFFVRAFAHAALIAASIAIVFVLANDGVPGLMKQAAVLVHLVREFDFFVKGLLVGKFCAGFMKWKRVRQHRAFATEISTQPNSSSR